MERGQGLRRKEDSLDSHRKEGQTEATPKEEVKKKKKKKRKETDTLEGTRAVEERSRRKKIKTTC